MAAPALLWSATALAIRFVTSLWPAGARVVVPPYVLAAQAMRCASLMARATPSPAWADTSFILLELATVFYSLFVSTLGIELPAWATFMGLREKEPPGLVLREAASGYLFTLPEEEATPGKGGKEE